MVQQRTETEMETREKKNRGRERERKIAPFHVLVLSLSFTGTCPPSPYQLKTITIPMITVYGKWSMKERVNCVYRAAASSCVAIVCVLLHLLIRVNEG